MPQLSASAPISNRHLDLLITNHFSALTSHPPRDGGGGIRTHEGLRPAGFQDRSHQPLDHPSEVFVLRSVPLTTRWASRAAGARIIGSTLWPRLLAAAEFHRRIPRPTTAATKKPRQRVMFS